MYRSAYESNTDLLFRARHNRALSNGNHLWDSIAAQPVEATVSVDIPDKTGKKKIAVEAEVRYHEVEILRPASNKDSYNSVTLTDIEIKEKNTEGKKDEDIIHWKLLTTLEISNVSDVLQCVKMAYIQMADRTISLRAEERNQNRRIAVERRRGLTKSNRITWLHSG